jgi:hypothetical protein
MSTLPPGCKSVGPIYILIEDKELFETACKSEGKTMGGKLKELIDMVNGKKPWPVAPAIEVPNATRTQ